MSNIQILPYSPEDDAAALALEEKCVQGTSLKLRFRRPNFRARSELYEKSRIYCAHQDGELVGIIAGALKNVKLHGEEVRALYVYDLRVHPGSRRMGIGKTLTNALLDDLGKNAHCQYTLINGENEKALGLAGHNFAPSVVIPLTYAFIPVYKKQKESLACRFESAAKIRGAYERAQAELEFLPSPNEQKQAGHVASLALDGTAGAGCSIWTSENILAEQVVQIPFRMKTLRSLFELLKPFVKRPHIPGPDEVIRSWFLFNLYAYESESLKILLAAVNNLALNHSRTYLYVLMRNDAPILRQLRESHLKFFTLPYNFLAKGQVFPRETDNIYIDIRDL